MKYSYELDGVDYTVVKTKSGRMVEVRRGDLRGQAPGTVTAFQKEIAIQVAPD